MFYSSSSSPFLSPPFLPLLILSFHLHLHSTSFFFFYFRFVENEPFPILSLLLFQEMKPFSSHLRIYVLFCFFSSSFEKIEVDSSL